MLTDVLSIIPFGANVGEIFINYFLFRTCIDIIRKMGTISTRSQYVTLIWVNIGSGNGLLPDGTKPLPEPMLTYHQSGPVIITLRTISLEIHQPPITKITLKIAYLKFHWNTSGANNVNKDPLYTSEQQPGRKFWCRQLQHTVITMVVLNFL